MSYLSLFDSTADFSPCRTWRYTLWRRWKDGGKIVAFLCLNPSTADEVQNDPTIRRCIRFAQDWGYDGLCMTNIFAFRATDPKDMKAALDPVGPDNDMWLKKIVDEALLVVAAWGTHGNFKGRDADVTKILYSAMMRNGKDIRCLGLTKRGSPKHPLYLRKDSELIPLIEGCMP